MNKQNASDPSRWLIERWGKALQFEEARASARSYYEQLFKKVCEMASKKPEEPLRYVTHCFLEKVPEAAWKHSGGCVGFHKSKWQGDWSPWPPGIWIWNISLDELASERASAPTASIYLGFRKYNRRRLEELRKRLRKRTQRDPRWRTLNFQTDDESTREPWFHYDLPEERTELLNMVRRDGGRPFVNRIAKHVQLIADLLEGLDDFLR